MADRLRAGRKRPGSRDAASESGGFARWRSFGATWVGATWVGETESNERS